jgi:putative transposase
MAFRHTNPASVRYVLRNPVRAGIVRLPWRYEWSSAAFHVGEKKTDPLVKPNKELDEMVGSWQEYLVEPDADEVLCRLRSETAVGRPLGEAAFVQKLEEDLDRFLTRRPPGRPRKRGHNL